MNRPDDPADPVILAGYDGRKSVARIIARAGGLAGLTSRSRVLIKPNLGPCCELVWRIAMHDPDVILGIDVDADRCTHEPVIR